MTASVQRIFPATPRTLRAIRRFVTEEAAKHSFGEFGFDLALATNEACANAMLHAHGPELVVRIEAHRDRIVVEVRDTGVYRVEQPSLDPEREGQRGLMLMSLLVEELEIARGTEAARGTVVRLTKRKR